MSQAPGDSVPGDSAAPGARDLDASVARVTTAAARSALARLATVDLSEQRLLPILADLRRTFPSEAAAAILTLARLRRRARAKFPRADDMFFTSESLEQATAWAVADARAERLAALAPDGPVLDLGCGIGGDTLALARRREVIAYEIDAERLALARANAEALGVAGRVAFRHADWTVDLAAGRLPAAAAAFVDPSRRVGGRRVFRPADLVPPLAAVLRLRDHVPTLVVKLMPGVDPAELPAAAGVELVSHDGTCKEAVLCCRRPRGWTAGPRFTPPRPGTRSPPPGRRRPWAASIRPACCTSRTRPSSAPVPSPSCAGCSAVISSTPRSPTSWRPARSRPRSPRRSRCSRCTRSASSDSTNG